MRQYRCWKRHQRRIGAYAPFISWTGSSGDNAGGSGPFALSQNLLVASPGKLAPMTAGIYHGRTFLARGCTAGGCSYTAGLCCYTRASVVSAVSGSRRSRHRMGDATNGRYPRVMFPVECKIGLLDTTLQLMTPLSRLHQMTIVPLPVELVAEGAFPIDDHGRMCRAHFHRLHDEICCATFPILAAFVRHLKTLAPFPDTDGHRH